MSVLEAYSEHCLTSNIERIAKIVHGERPLTIFANRSITDNWQVFEDESEY